MNDITPRVAVIGCGSIAHAHLSHLQRLAADGRVDVVAVCDRSDATAHFAADRYGVGAWVTDVDRLLDQSRPDVVHVLTPPHTHADVAVRCLESGAHVLCEKPAARDLDELDGVLASAAAHQRHFIESQNLRWNDQILRLGRSVADGGLGQLRDIDLLMAVDITGGHLGDRGREGLARQLPGGAVHDVVPHLVYLFVELASGVEPLVIDQPDRVQVTGRIRNTTGVCEIGYDQLDAALTIGAVRGRLRVAPDLRPEGFRLTVRGTAGVFETDLYRPFATLQFDNGSGLRRALDPVAGGFRLASSAFTGLVDKVRGHDVFHGLGRLLDAWYTALGAGEEPPVTVASMRATAALTDRIVALGGA